MRSYSEECHGGSAFQCAIGDFVLISQILDGLNGRNHALDGEKSSQIGRVWRDDDEREKPPDAAHDARGSRLRFVSIKSCDKRVNLLTKRLLQSNEWTRKGDGIDRKAATEKDDALNNCSHHLAHSKLKFRAPFTWLVPSSTGQPITTLSRKEWSSVEWIIYVSLNRPSYAIYRPPRWRESINRQSRRGKMRNQWKSWSFLVTAGSRRRAREKYSFSHPTEGIV